MIVCVLNCTKMLYDKMWCKLTEIEQQYLKKDRFVLIIG